MPIIEFMLETLLPNASENSQVSLSRSTHTHTNTRLSALGIKHTK